MEGQLRCYSGLDESTLESLTLMKSDTLIPSQRDESRRLLVRLMDHRLFHLTVFMARRLYAMHTITAGDFDFFIGTVCLALRNRHQDVADN